MIPELEAVALLRRVFGGGAPGVTVGIGDDAAVLDGGLVWTIDAQVEGTHFRSAWLSWEDVGWRSFMAAASDLAAMGATPLAALSALSLAASIEQDALAALARGQAAAAAAVAAPVVGGNLARGTETSITTTLLGRAARPVLRSGARAGDALFLAGPVGLAAAGLVALQRKVQDARVAPALDAWRRPRARIAEGLAMAAYAHAAIDVSDGLARDASHLAEASGVRVVLDGSALASPELAATASALDVGALDLALSGGEDYALLVAADAAEPSIVGAGFVRVGVVEPYEGGARVWLRDAHGTRAIEASGFDHFA